MGTPGGPYIGKSQCHIAAFPSSQIGLDLVKRGSSQAAVDVKDAAERLCLGEQSSDQIAVGPFVGGNEFLHSLSGRALVFEERGSGAGREGHLADILFLSRAVFAFCAHHQNMASPSDILLSVQNELAQIVKVYCKIKKKLG